MASFLNRMDLAGMLFSWMFLQFVKSILKHFFQNPVFTWLPLGENECLGISMTKVWVFL